MNYIFSYVLRIGITLARDRETSNIAESLDKQTLNSQDP